MNSKITIDSCKIKAYTCSCCGRRITADGGVIRYLKIICNKCFTIAKEVSCGRDEGTVYENAGHVQRM